MKKVNWKLRFDVWLNKWATKFFFWSVKKMGCEITVTGDWQKIQK